jgi:hypothetical protein
LIKALVLIKWLVRLPVSVCCTRSAQKTIGPLDIIDGNGLHPGARAIFHGETNEIESLTAKAR